VKSKFAISSIDVDDDGSRSLLSLINCSGGRTRIMQQDHSYNPIIVESFGGVEHSVTESHVVKESDKKCAAKKCK